MFKAIASSIMASVLRDAKDQVIELAKVELIRQAREKVRLQVLEEVAKKYSEEVEHNISQYIEALASSNVEVTFSGKPGEAIVNRAEGALRELEIYLEKQNPDGAVIKYLQSRYREEGIGIRTGRLYAGHFVKTSGQGTFEVMNKMGYATYVDKTRPWLTGSETSKGLAEMIAQAATELFEMSFDGVDLSDPMANLSFVGDIERKYSGQGFAPSKQSALKNKKKKRGK